jgi:hypothetical protein
MRNKWNEDVGPSTFLRLPMADIQEDEPIPVSEAELSLDEQIDIYLFESQQALDLSLDDDVLMI